MRRESELRKWLKQTRAEPLEGMAAFFDRRVGGYEAHMSRWRQHYRRMAELLPPDTDSLLDLGCGTGLELDCIFRRFPALEVTGVDLCAAMLAELERKHAGRRITLICGDYFHTDLGEARFDAAVSFETLHHFTAEKKQRLFEALFRSLKPGGVYLECDYIAASPEIEALLYDECRRRRERDGISDEVFVHFDTPLTLEHELQTLERAGFSAEPLGFLPGDGDTAMIRAVKRTFA